MKTSELIKELTDSLAMNGDLTIHTIMNGKIDTNPTINVDNGIVYIEGVVREDEEKIILTAEAKVRLNEIHRLLNTIGIKLGLHN